MEKMTVILIAEPVVAQCGGQGPVERRVARQATAPQAAAMGGGSLSKVGKAKAMKAYELVYYGCGQQSQSVQNVDTALERLLVL